MLMYLIGPGIAASQVDKPIDPVIEGGKIVVELIKAISGKNIEKNPGCKNSWADLCIFNESAGSLTIQFTHRLSAETREIVVLPGMKECCLQAKVGVWTYDLRQTGTINSIRKGDLLIEGCQHMLMSIKY